MLPREYRLRCRTDIARVRQDGRPWRHPLAVLVAHPPTKQMIAASGDSLPPTRFAVIAGKGVGNAVHRNRAKRLLREAVRSQLPEINRGWDCLLIARQGTPAATLHDVEGAVRRLFSRSGLYNLQIDKQREPKEINP